MNYYIPNKLLGEQSTKTEKGEKKGYKTHILYLAPHKQNSKRRNLCTHASKGCAKACLFNSGAARFSNVQKGKINKTEYFLSDREGFLRQLDTEISIIASKKDKFTHVIRLNGTSDINWAKFKIRDNKNIFELYPQIQFYDYTKNHFMIERNKYKNYHITFSMNEINKEKSFELLKKGFNVAMVFATINVNELPKEYEGYKVINGDEDDLRFLDEKNVIVGLKYKFLTGKGTKGLNKEMLENNDFLIKL
jgi:hypothetical protein